MSGTDFNTTILPQAKEPDISSLITRRPHKKRRHKDNVPDGGVVWILLVMASEAKRAASVAINKQVSVTAGATGLRAMHVVA